MGDFLIYLLGGLLACLLKRGDAGRADRLPDDFLRDPPGGWGRDFDSILLCHSLAGELILPGLDILRDPELLADGLVSGRVFDALTDLRRGHEFYFQNSDLRGGA